MATIRTENTTYIVKAVYPKGTNEAFLHRRSLTAPAAASTTAVHAAINSAALVTTGITNPDFPRNITVVGAGSGHNAAGTVTINGTDVRDAVISEVLTLNSNTTVAGNKAFKTVTSIDFTAVTGNDANNTVAVGIGTKFGLTRKMDSNGLISSTVDGASDTAGTIAFSASSISNNTVSPNTAPNASHNYIFTYVTTDIYVTS